MTAKTMNQIATLLLTIVMCLNGSMACVDKQPEVAQKQKELQFDMPQGWDMGYQDNTWFGPGGDWGPTNITIYTRIRGSNAKTEAEAEVKDINQYNIDQGVKRWMKTVKLGGRETYISYFYSPDLDSLYSGTVYIDLDSRVIEIIVRDNPDNHLKDLDHIIRSMRWEWTDQKEEN